MKILYVFGELDAAGGLQRVQTEKANYFANLSGFDVAILTTLKSPDSSPYFNLNGRVGVFVANQYSLNEWGGRAPLFARLRMALSYREYAKRVIKDFCPDVIVQAGGYEIIFMMGIYGKAKFICEFHFSCGSEKFSPKRSFFEMCCRFLTSRVLDFIRTTADVFVVLSKEDLRSWKKRGLRFKKVMHIYNSLPALNVSTAGQLRKKKVIAVGRLDFQKSFKDLIYIWSRVEAIHPDWILEVYGDGPEKTMLLEEVERFNLKHIKFCGKIKDIYDKMMQSELFVMTSVFEGFPVVMLEAMACSLPCVSFNFKCGPAELIVDGENGFLVDGRNADLFSKKLSILMSDDELRLRQSVAARRSIEIFSKERIMQQWHELYLSLK